LGVICWTAATSCSGVVLVVAASFVKIRPFSSAFAASGSDGEKIKTFCGSVGKPVWVVLAADIVFDFELLGLATSSCRVCGRDLLNSA
jgi:hypothetical protein